MKTLKTIILAAGKGVRMKSELPKVLHLVCGMPMIDYILDIAKSLGSLKNYIVLGHQSGLVKKYLGKQAAVVLQKKLIGTADAVKSAQQHFKNDKGCVLILSGDTPLLEKETIKKLVKKHMDSKASCTFLTAMVHHPRGYGRVLRDAAGDVIAIREEMDASPEEKATNEINVGAYCFQSQILFESIGNVKINEKKKEFYLTDIISLLVGKGAKVATETTEDFREGLGINTREDLATAESILRKRFLRKLMLDGVTIIDPETTFIASDAKIGQDTVIHPFTVIENNVNIGSKCAIGPFCRIRSGTKIGHRVEVRNFTEVSRSTIGDNCFMKHFSFIGDAQVGRNVNIGAGVVTANFDGTNKNITRIHDGAFIGSDSILVAPTTIGKKAVTAAGCVVTKGTKVPNGQMAIGVPAKIKPRRK